jgi:hypothetical protein
VKCYQNDSKVYKLHCSGVTMAENQKTQTPTTGVQTQIQAQGQGQVNFVLIGPFDVEWAGEKRILVEYRGENIIPKDKREIWLDSVRIHNAYEKDKLYYFIYETKNTDYYLQYATTLPSDAKQVSVLKIPYGCKYIGDEDEDEISTSMEGCWEINLADGVEWVHREFKIPNDINPSMALSEYKPDLDNWEVLTKILEIHGIKVQPLPQPPVCQLVELRSVGEGFETVGKYAIRYRDVIGFVYCDFYDDPWPTATRIQLLRIYLTNSGKGIAKRILGDVPLSEVTDSELKSLNESKILAIAAEYDDKDALELLQRAGIEPGELWLLDRKPGLIPYFADRIVSKVINKLKTDVDAYKNPYRYHINEKILNAARRELVEEYEKLMRDVMEKYEKWRKAEEERRRKEEEERRKKFEKVAEDVKRELEKHGIKATVRVNDFGVEVRNEGYIDKRRFNEYLKTMKSHNFKFNPKGKYWYYYA